MEEAEALARASVKEQLGDALRSIAEDAAPPGGHALIIDGKALLHALGDDVKASLLAVSPYLAMHLVVKEQPSCRYCPVHTCSSGFTGMASAREASL